MLPVTHVNALQDELPRDFKPRNSIEKSVYKMYDAKAMEGLPVGVQVVGKRLEEEKVLCGMSLVEYCLELQGIAYKPLEA